MNSVDAAAEQPDTALTWVLANACLLYTSDAADEEDSFGFGGIGVIIVIYLTLSPSQFTVVIYFLFSLFLAVYSTLNLFLTTPSLSVPPLT